MSSCDRAQSLFGRAWDDELTASERDGLELHMKDCAGCRREYDELARTLELVQTLPRPQVGEEFATRVLAEALRRENEAPAPRRIFALPSFDLDFGRVAFGRPALAMAATFVVAVAAAVVLMRGPAVGPASNPAPSVAAIETQAATPATPAPTVPTPAPAVEAPSAAVPTTVVAVERESAPAPSRRRAAANPSPLVAEGPAIPDSLFDHTADVELVLDPVKLRRERGRGYTPTSVRGEAASITF